MDQPLLIFLLGALSAFSQELIWVTAVAIALLGLDDLAFDLVWLGGTLFRKNPALPSKPAQASRFIIFIPAWDESAVIGRMLQRLISTLNHPDYLVFVGVYPNDVRTLQAVQSVQDPRVVSVVVSQPGPTTKADCLNQLWDALTARERQEGWRAKAVVLHDAEDVVHPYELTLFDRVMPGLQMVQVPVLPLKDRRSHFVAGHYLDEFAESHAKDLLVRQWIGAPVPSAGVGTAIDRDALDKVANMFGRPFDPDSLTEDYELGHKLHALGYRAAMVRHYENGELVATREYFPATFKAAIRQKGRWLTGIALAGWDRIGWPVGWATRWMLWRDRKSLITAAIAILAYLLLALIGFQFLLRDLMGIGHFLPPIIDVTPTLRTLLLFNAFLLVWRLAFRFGFSRATHGWGQAFLSLPRASVANVINFMAALRAFGQYRQLIETGAALKWEKTFHRFPDSEMEIRHG